VHGVTSLLVSGFLPGGASVAALVRDAMIDQLTVSAPARRAGAAESKRRKRS
jgi:hypothetical protein